MLDLNKNYTLPAFVHNLVLERIGNLPVFPDFTLEDAYQIGVDALNDTLNPGTEPFPAPVFNDVEPFYINISEGSTLSEIIVDLANQQLIDSTTELELKSLESIISSSESFDYFDEKINLYINEINNNEELSITGRIICLSSANIAIASKNFWLNAHNDSSSPWHQIVQDDDFLQTEQQSKTTKKKRGWFVKVLLVVACDVGGGAIGGALGSILGPAGAVAGATMVGGGASAAATKNL